ncbi:MAG: nodulation protein NfeD [Gammaproteobacteria bacterium]|jgi:membrane-bound serine protease (ClpP class)|nr:nodulation protein NfeD [Gammaproteobacteria bacterium]MDH3821269.1 nodulation protein NfeD [Gammaproteobacteria bacterium]MDH3984229.1 nodulation protein NfeD [Gammaproteobacteria bacterium]
MKVPGRSSCRTFPVPALLLLLTLLWSASSTAAPTRVVELEIDGPIGVATADYLNSGIEHAEEIGAELIIITIDTPGGLMKPMREIVQGILASTVPIAAYVGPAGARADSAGTYILLACHIAAMTPTSHLGAATPVPLVNSPAKKDSDDETAAPAMDRKIMNDAVSYIRSLADRHGRNADWAESAVTDAATLTAQEALEKNVIEFIAENQQELLALVDGYEVEIAGTSRTISTGDAEIEAFEANWRIRLLTVISNPEIVLLLGLIGLYGLMYEGWNPGAIVPGVVGAICLLLAAYALQVLPVNYAGLALIIVGIALMVAEAYAPSFGALGLGGIAAFVFGAIIMFDSGVPGFGISYAFVIGLGLGFAVLLIWLLGYLLKLRRRGAVTGKGSIVGGTAIAMEDFEGDGKVWLEGEAWHARSRGAVTKDEQLIVTRLDGLTLDVEPVTKPEAPASD